MCHPCFCQVTRQCFRNDPHNGYKETTGIKWCSGGGDYAPGDVFGAGVEGLCPLAPPTWTANATVAACEAVCFSLYERFYVVLCARVGLHVKRVGSYIVLQYGTKSPIQC